MLARIRPFIAVAAAGAGVWLLVEIVSGEPGGARALLALSGIVWAGVALGVGYLLPVLPSAVADGDRFPLRLRKRIVLLAYLLSLAVAVGLVLLAAGLSYRAIGLGLDTTDASVIEMQ